MWTTPEEFEVYHKKREKALKAGLIARKAIANGLLIRPDTCELCEKEPGYIRSGDREHLRPKIQAHHWRGYDFPLDVWFICDVCNIRLKGEEFHNGSVTKEQAREFIIECEKRVIIRIPYPCKAIVKTTGEPCKKYTTKGDFCISHQRAIERGSKVTAKD